MSATPLEPFRVAALQMVSTPDRERNLAEAEKLIAEAAAAGARLVLLPEYFCFMGHKDSEKLAIREPHGDGPIQRFLADAAKRHGVWVIGGTLPLKAPEDTRVLNSTLVFDPSGEERARYDKIHLFNFEKGAESFDEARTIRPGAEVRTFEAPFGRVGLSVCYDLRFPELYRRMGDCALMVVPSAFTYTTGRAHWQILLRARAIENQCFVIAPNQIGAHPPGHRAGGRSLIVDPWGLVLSSASDTETAIVADLDFATLDSVRRRIPALRHRRPDVYGWKV